MRRIALLVFAGSLTLAEARWKKSMQRKGVRPYALEPPKKPITGPA